MGTGACHVLNRYMRVKNRATVIPYLTLLGRHVCYPLYITICTFHRVKCIRYTITIWVSVNLLTFNLAVCVSRLANQDHWREVGGR